ncbi:MAG TPA: branched-chain amino acid ABC transporter permease, partial [Burkholderiaceae bacterium]|nr:branched-chain amino acid ABC transporter permease [Burkholderiaceae bacterium]
LLGYTGIVSFAHTMFFGIGAYGVAIACANMGPTWGALLVGVVIAVLLSALLSMMIGLFSLRVRAIFYSMITLAVAFAFQTLASQLSDLTGGEDGLNFSLPEFFSPSYQLFEQPVFGATIDGKLITYYVVFFVTVLLFLCMLRIVNSAFGRVLQAIRENTFRAEAIGYNTVIFRTAANMLSAIFATLAGALLALWLRYNSADTSLSFEIMIDILLIVVIGGMGTLYGAICGATIFILAQNYLEDLMAHGASATQEMPLLATLLSPDRWLLWLGVLFVLSVYFLPTGIVGKLRSLKR